MDLSLLLNRLTAAKELESNLLRSKKIALLRFTEQEKIPRQA